MKSAQFDYVKVDSVAAALALLSEHVDDARILAGGQTLLATLNMRLSEPTLLIDIAGIDELRRIEVCGDRLHIGALVTHSTIESSDLVAEHAPMLTAAAPHIAHRAIRNAGTWGGSIAYGDPAAEWPCCLVALDGVVVVQGPKGQRRVGAKDFFQNLYTTDLQPDEIIVSADVPLTSTVDWFGFDELARRHGDYAIAGLAIAARFEGSTLTRIRLSFLGLGATPLRAPATEALLEGRQLDDAALASAVASLKKELDPMADLHNEGGTKLHLATVLATRLLTAAHHSRMALRA